MSVLRNREIKKLSKQQAVEKLAEMEKGMLELRAEGKREKATPLKQAIARLKTYIHQLSKTRPLSEEKPAEKRTEKANAA